MGTRGQSFLPAVVGCGVGPAPAPLVKQCWQCTVFSWLEAISELVMEESFKSMSAVSVIDINLFFLWF